MLIILHPGDEGNFTGQWLVVERNDYVKWLTGVKGDYRHDSYQTAQQAWDACYLGNS